MPNKNSGKNKLHAKRRKEPAFHYDDKKGFAKDFSEIENYLIIQIKICLLLLYYISTLVFTFSIIFYFLNKISFILDMNLSKLKVNKMCWFFKYNMRIC